MATPQNADSNRVTDSMYWHARREATAWELVYEHVRARLVQSKRAAGQSFGQIATDLNLSKPMVTRILTLGGAGTELSEDAASRLKASWVGAGNPTAAAELASLVAQGPPPVVDDDHPHTAHHPGSPEGQLRRAVLRNPGKDTSQIAFEITALDLGQFPTIGDIRRYLEKYAQATSCVTDTEGRWWPRITSSELAPGDLVARFEGDLLNAIGHDGMWAVVLKVSTSENDPEKAAVTAIVDRSDQIVSWDMAAADTVITKTPHPNSRPPFLEYSTRAQGLAILDDFDLDRLAAIIRWFGLVNLVGAHHCAVPCFDNGAEGIVASPEYLTLAVTTVDRIKDLEKTAPAPDSESGEALALLKEVTALPRNDIPGRFWDHFGRELPTADQLPVAVFAGRMQGLHAVDVHRLISVGPHHHSPITVGQTEAMSDHTGMIG